MKRNKLALLFGVLSSSVFAGDQLVFPLASHHVGSSYEYNESNIGVGFQHDTIGVLTYNNSFSDQSVFAYYDYVAYDQNDFKVGTYSGLVTGYDASPLMPVTTPYLQYGPMNLSVIPSFAAGMEAELVYCFSIRLEI